MTELAHNPLTPDGKSLVLEIKSHLVKVLADLDTGKSVEDTLASLKIMCQLTDEVRVNNPQLNSNYQPTVIEQAVTQETISDDMWALIAPESYRKFKQMEEI